MELRECYEKMGGDYEAVLGRLKQDERIVKFLRLFPRDTNFADLQKALAEEDWELAFRAAHSLKGVSLNLGLASLADSSSELTEILRGGAPKEDPAPLFAQVQQDYEKIMETIAEAIG